MRLTKHRTVYNRSVALAAGLLLGTLAAPALHAQNVVFAGAQVPVPASIQDARGMAADAAGNLFITDNAEPDITNSRVVKLPAGGGPQITVISGLFQPVAVTLDAAGDLFIVDHSRVQKLPAGGGPPISLGSRLDLPVAVAADAAGNVFIADETYDGILEVPAGGGPQTMVGSGLAGPSGVAVDSAGNLFVSDTHNGRVLEFPVGGGPQITVPTSGVVLPGALAVDAAGDLFVFDQNSNSVGVFPASGAPHVTVGLYLQLAGFGIDPSGDIFITNRSQVWEMMRPAVNFGTANLCPAGQTTPAPCRQTLPLQFGVTSSGTLGSINVLTSGAPNLDFTLGAGSNCTGSVAAGTCTVNVTFAPRFAGPRNGAVQITDASGNILATTFIRGMGLGPQIGFSGGPITTGGFSQTYGVAVDGAGNRYVTDPGSSSVVEVPANGGPQITLGSGWSFPTGVAVDGAGNVFIADEGNSRVVEIAAGGAQTLVGGGWIRPIGIALDGAGNLFVTDYVVGVVLKVPADGSAQATIATGFQNPWGVAVDGAGNIFVADSLNSRIVEIPAGGGAQITLASGFSRPTGVAVDAAGDVFITDQLATGILELPAGGGPQITLANGSVYDGNGVALDGAGNLFVADLNGIDELPQSLQPTLNFGPSPWGYTSPDSPQSIAIVNNGNAPLTASGLAVAGDFAQVPGYGSPADCTADFSLAPGASCNLSISFTPSVVGPLQGTATLTDNAMNGNPSTQSVLLNGLGQPDYQTMAFNVPSAQIVGASVSLTGSASSGLPVTFQSLSPGICRVSGTTATMIAVGTCVIEEDQAGNSLYAPAYVQGAFPVNPGTSFTIIPIPGSETVRGGILGAFLLELKSVSGFKGNVKLSCAGGPPGTVCADLPQTVHLNGTALAVSGILFPAKTKPGTYTITFTGVSGSLSSTATAKFTVK